MTIDPNTAPTELLPCPFCGSTDIATDGPSYTLFMCNECGGQTYDQDSHAEAIAAWNRRAPTATLPDGMEVVGWAYRGPRGGLIVTEDKPKHAPEAKPLVRQSEAATQITRLEADVVRLTKEREDAEGINLLDGDGWVFWNPDSGEEYSDSDPAHSGECDDAERVRKSTAQEDVLWRAVQSEFTARLTAEAQNKAIREAGSQLANCAYNLSQPSQAMRLEERTRATLKECCEAWDRAARQIIDQP